MSYILPKSTCTLAAFGALTLNNTRLSANRQGQSFERMLVGKALVPAGSWELDLLTKKKETMNKEENSFLIISNNFYQALYLTNQFAVLNFKLL
jgi:hypothetical protein